MTIKRKKLNKVKKEPKKTLECIIKASSFFNNEKYALVVELLIFVSILGIIF